MNISGATTTTTVEFSSHFSVDSVELVGGEFSAREKQKVIDHVDRIRKLAYSSDGVKVKTKNTFPKGAGIASSASGFAALTVAGCEAGGLKLSEKEISVLARIGSGSACRSIPDGFVKWETGETSQASFAYSLFPETYWDLRDLLVLVDSGQKTISTTEGMDRVSTSPFWNLRSNDIQERIVRVEHGLKTKDLTELGKAMEEDCMSMHAVSMTEEPPVFYWNETTFLLIESVIAWRKKGIPVYFTIDAGPNVHLICEGKSEKRVADALKGISRVQSVLTNSPSVGTRIVNAHLF